MVREKLYSFQIAKEEGGLRLDVFLASHPELSLSRAQIQKAISAGMVLLNNLPAKPGQRLLEGDHLYFEKMPPAAADVLPENIPLNIIYEDQDLLVIDKPAGMVVHPAAGNYHGTLVNALLFHCRDLSGIGGVMRPGIVHRLDKGTSGLMVVAKNDMAHQALAAQFKARQVRKTYLALVYGNVRQEEGKIDAPVGRDWAYRKKMSTRSRHGREAHSRWRVLARYGGLTLLEVVIETGRTHQIRVHLHYIGYPIVGDAEYGGGSQRTRAYPDTLLRAKLKDISRPALHAARLEFAHPRTGRSLSFASALPPDITSICDLLNARCASSLPKVNTKGLTS